MLANKTEIVLSLVKIITEMFHFQVINSSWKQSGHIVPHTATTNYKALIPLGTICRTPFVWVNTKFRNTFYPRWTFINWSQWSLINQGEVWIPSHFWNIWSIQQMNRSLQAQFGVTEAIFFVGKTFSAILTAELKQAVMYCICVFLKMPSVVAKLSTNMTLKTDVPRTCENGQNSLSKPCLDADPLLLLLLYEIYCTPD